MYGSMSWIDCRCNSQFPVRSTVYNVNHAHVLLMPDCAEANQAMQELTGINYNSGEQNKDMTAARQACDWKDTLTVLQYLQEWNLFSLDPSLRSISTVVHAHPTVNVDEAVAVWGMILTQMNGTTPAGYTFQKTNQVVT